MPGQARRAPGAAVGAAAQQAMQTAPGKPSDFSAAPGDGTLTLSFQVVDDGGSVITGYDYSTDNGVTWRPLGTVTGTTTKQSVVTHESGGSLTLGYNIPYTVLVRAVNAHGPGVASDPFSATIPPKEPDAPYDITVGVGPSAVTLGFSLPRDYGSPISSWEYTTDNGVTWRPLATTGSTRLSATVTHQSTGDGSTALQPGQPYQLRFHALNAEGPGRDSQTFTVSLPAPGAPAAPAGVSAAPAGEGFAVDFSAPSPGDSAIVKYQYSTDDGGTWADATTTGTGPLRTVLEVESAGPYRIAHGRPYRIRVRAVNSQGPGMPSSAAEATLPSAPPGAPWDLAAVPRAEGGLALSFGNPPNNGSPINGWEYTTDEGAHWQPLGGVSGDMRLAAAITTESVDGSTALRTGVSYRIQVRALNAHGPGAESQTVTAELPNPGAPAAPAGVSAAPAGEGFTVDFSAPSPGDSAIVKYQYSTDDGNTWADATTTGTGPLRAVLEVESAGPHRIARGHPYFIRIRAVNAQGAGMPSDRSEASLPATAPGAPWNPAAVPRAEGGFALSFDHPPNNGSPINGWEYTTDEGVHWQPLSGVSGDMRLTAAITTESVDGSTALRTGVSYRIQVRALNAHGPGAESQTVTAELPNPGAPAAPIGVTAAEAGENFTVEFTAPSPGDSAIVKYQYSTDDGGTWADATTTGTGPLRATLEVESQSGWPLAHVRPYRIRIRAVNAQGAGMPSDAAEASLSAAAPEGPWDLRIQPGDRTMTLTFGIPPNNGSPLTGWEYTTDNGAHWQPLHGVTGEMQGTATISTESDGTTPLSNGTLYQVRIRALNALGTGPDSETVAIGLPNPGAPAAPGPITLVPAGDGFGVEFTAPAQGDSPILRYQYSSDDGRTWADAATTGTGPLQAALDVESQSGWPFARGIGYFIRIRAVNSQGPGMPSEQVEGTLSPSAPGAPVDLSAQAGDGTVTITWNRPMDNGSQVTDFEYSTDDGGTWRLLPPYTVNEDFTLTSTITALQNGQTYVLRLRAINALGTGPDSEPLRVDLPLPGAPGKPTSLSLAPIGDHFGVDFTAGGPGDSAIVKYQYSSDDGGTWADITPTGTGPLHVEISAESGSGLPLQYDVRYDIRLRAVNAQGPGLPSDPVGRILAPSEPGAPSGITARPGDRQAAVTFTAPPPHGTPITGYDYSTDGGTTWQSLAGYTSGPSGVQATIFNLSNGVAYRLVLRASNEIGPGPASEVVPVTPYAAPSAPSALTAAPGKAQATLTFPAPGTGGSPITGYEYSTDGGVSWAALSAPTGTGTLTSVITTASGQGRPVLAGGTTYQIRVRALNAAGPGAPSPAAALTLSAGAGVPRGLTAAPRNRAALLTFGAPAEGDGITGYQVSIDNGGSWAALGTASGDGGLLTGTVGNLSNDSTYQIQVRAVTAAGPGAATAAVSVTPLAPPAAPSGVVATPETATITVSWRAPAPGGAPITGYTAIASPGPATCEAVETTTCVLGARADQPYTVVVVAHSASGDSAASAPSASVTAESPVIPSTPPAADEELGAEAGADGDVDAVQPGEKVTIRGSGYAPNSTVEVVVYSEPVSLGTVLTDDNGEFSLDIAVPPNLSGTHSIVAMGADPDGNVRSLRLDVTVAPAPASEPGTGGSQPGDGDPEQDDGESRPGDGGDLPTTGAATGDMATLGLFVMLLGAGMVRASRRRRA